jgi:hypothetical protein
MLLENQATIEHDAQDHARFMQATSLQLTIATILMAVNNKDERDPMGPSLVFRFSPGIC